MTSFYSEEELKTLGLRACGRNVLLSRRASIYGAQEISIGDNVRIDDFCILSGRVALGSYIHIAAYTALYGGDAGITVADFANLSSRVAVYSVSDDYSGETLTNPMIPDKYKHIDSRPVHIGRHVIIGSTSVVLPGSDIGEGCAFGSFSFIRGEIAPWGVYAGIPVKRLKDRKRDLLALEQAFLAEEQSRS